MDIGRVLKRAWHMVWHYRALWVFGIVLALTTGSWGTYAILGDNDDDGAFRRGITITRIDNETFGDAVQRTLRQEVAAARVEIREAERELEYDLGRFSAKELKHPVDVNIDIMGLLTWLLGVLLVLVIVSTIARHVSEAALIQMVDGYEETGERLGFRQGLRLGFSRTAWRLFLIELLVDVPTVVVLVALYTAVFAPLALGLWGGTSVTVVAGSFVTVGLLLLALAATFVVVAILSLLKQFFRRACAVDQLGVMASIGQGYAVARRHILNAGVMGLILVGLGLAWSIAMIPVVIAVMLAAGALGAAPAYLAFVLSSTVWTGAAPVLLAIGVGLVAFFLALVAPLAFLGGLRMVFVSSTWTLTYRELRGSESPERVRTPEADASALGAAPAG